MPVICVTTWVSLDYLLWIILSWFFETISTVSIAIICFNWCSTVFNCFLLFSIVFFRIFNCFSTVLSIVYTKRRKLWTLVYVYEIIVSERVTKNLNETRQWLSAASDSSFFGLSLLNEKKTIKPFQIVNLFTLLSICTCLKPGISLFFPFKSVTINRVPLNGDMRLRPNCEIVVLIVAV